MKYLIIILFFLSSVCYSQSIGIPKCKLKDVPQVKIQWHNEKYTPLERTLITLGAVALVTGLDIAIYPEVQGTNMEDPYRMFQGALQLGTSYGLLKEVGLSSAIGFNVMLLFGANDAGYYLLRPSEFTGNFNHLPLNPVRMLNGNRLSKTDFKWGVGFSIYLADFLNRAKL